MTQQSRIGKVEKIVCPHCGTDTKHTILHSYDTNWDDGNEYGIDGGTTHDFMQCNGCETSTLRMISWCSEAEPGDVSTTLFPPRLSEDPARKPKNYIALAYGGPLDSAYRQTISAANLQLRILASAGVRLVIEGVCKHLGVSDGEHFDDTGAVIKNKKTGKNQRFKDLFGRINGMVERGFVTKTQANALHQIRLLGNDTAHELEEPSTKLLNTAIDIVEHMLDQVYEQPEKTKILTARKRPLKK